MDRGVVVEKKGGRNIEYVHCLCKNDKGRILNTVSGKNGGQVEFHWSAVHIC